MFNHRCDRDIKLFQRHCDKYIIQKKRICGDSGCGYDKPSTKKDVDSRRLALYAGRSRIRGHYLSGIISLLEQNDGQYILVFKPSSYNHACHDFDSNFSDFGMEYSDFTIWACSKGKHNRSVERDRTIICE